MSPEEDDQPGGKKPNEKEREKRQEKGQGLDEKYRRNPLGFVAWALVIIWFGVSLLLQNLDLFGDGNEDQQWAIFVWGAGPSSSSKPVSGWWCHGADAPPACHERSSLCGASGFRMVRNRSSPAEGGEGRIESGPDDTLGV